MEEGCMSFPSTYMFSKQMHGELTLFSSNVGGMILSKPRLNLGLEYLRLQKILRQTLCFGIAAIIASPSKTAKLSSSDFHQ